jgi:anti-sigma factor RsiW
VAELAHPSVDDLADLAEGLLADQRLQAVSAHLATCGDCAAAAAALDEVRVMLADAGSVAEPMPQSVSAALDAALRRASAERAAGVTSLTGRRSAARPRARRWAVLAGAAAAVVVLGYVGASLLHGGGGGDTTSSADSGGRSAPVNSAAGGAATGSNAPPATRQPSFSEPPLGKASDVVTPRTLSAYASRLVNSHRFVDRTPTCRAAVHVPAGASVATVRWKGRRAAVVADPSSHRVNVYACGGSAELFSTTY